MRTDIDQLTRRPKAANQALAAASYASRDLAKLRKGILGDNPLDPREYVRQLEDIASYLIRATEIIRKGDQA